MLFFPLFALSTVSSLHTVNMGYYRARKIETAISFFWWDNKLTVTIIGIILKEYFSPLGTRYTFALCILLYISVECRVICDNVQLSWNERSARMLESRLFSLTTARYLVMVSNKCLFALFAHEMRFSARYLYRAVRSNNVTPFWYYMSLTCAQKTVVIGNGGAASRGKMNLIWKNNNFPERREEKKKGK